MSKIDGRKISDQDRERIRFNAISDWLKGMKPTPWGAWQQDKKRALFQDV